jgi:hypothetical protein
MTSCHPVYNLIWTSDPEIRLRPQPVQRRLQRGKAFLIRRLVGLRVQGQDHHATALDDGFGSIDLP